jgi:hypothetical protein
MDELGFIGEPLWLSGKVMECENKLNQKIPGSLPSPGNLLKNELGFSCKVVFNVFAGT